MRKRLTSFSALLGLLTSMVAAAFGSSAKAQCPRADLHETEADCPWAQVTRSIEGLDDPDQVRKVIQDALPNFLNQLEQDHRLPTLLSLWGLSRNIDESHLESGRRTVPANLLKSLNQILQVPYDDSFAVGHAGLNHTYGYLFSTVETPYGYKRARYIRHEIEAGFGLKEGELSGTPKTGSLLLNLTLFAGKIAFRDSEEGMKAMTDLSNRTARYAPSDILKFNFAPLKPERLIEQIQTENESIEMRTDLIPFNHPNPNGKNSSLLIHSLLIQKKGAAKAQPVLITVFPVESGMRTGLFDPKTLGDAVPLKLRFNAALPFTLPPEKMVGKRFIAHERP